MKLSKMLEITAETVIITNIPASVRTECRRAVIRTLGNASHFEQLATKWAMATSHLVPRAGGPHLGRALLLKWLLLLETDYDAIFFTDSDVDIWSVRLGPLLL